jgi:pimeloyl-ACP methyl ester carboxylesterase
VNVYIISGLGADHRAFQYLHWPPQVNTIFLDWLQPERGETLPAYAQRMSKRIDHSTPFILIGLSFGGMLATEIATRLQPQKTILISSISSRKELPLYLKWGGKLRLHKIMPAQAGHKGNFVSYWFMGLQKDKQLLKEVLTSKSKSFSRWAVDAIIHWSRKEPPPGLIRIHGNKDKVLPMKKITPDHIVEGGGHLMIASHAATVSAIVGKIIQETGDQ